MDPDRRTIHSFDCTPAVKLPFEAFRRRVAHLAPELARDGTLLRAAHNGISEYNDVEEEIARAVDFLRSRAVFASPSRAVGVVRTAIEDEDRTVERVA